VVPGSDDDERNLRSRGSISIFRLYRNILVDFDGLEWVCG